jgi:hypothetical protein
MFNIVCWWNRNQHMINYESAAVPKFAEQRVITAMNKFIRKTSLSSVHLSYDLTVNSFGKAFAHVRNCLLMKKMSDVQKSNRGRTKTLTESTQKRHKKEDSAKYNPNEFSVRSYEYWAGQH